MGGRDIFKMGGPCARFSTRKTGKFEKWLKKPTFFQLLEVMNSDLAVTLTLSLHIRISLCPDLGGMTFPTGGHIGKNALMG